MPVFQIGQTSIPYQLRRSARLSERRITVTPEAIEVVALTTDGEAEVEGFLQRKRQWLLHAVRDVERIKAERHAVPRFATGSKVLYRGRRMPLVVRRSNKARAEVHFRNGFLVELPRWAGAQADYLVASELKLWLKQRVRRDVVNIAKRYGTRFDLHPRAIRVTDLIHGWGACSTNGTVAINWHLIFAPSKVLEYVVAHELAHLRHRNHGAYFWTYLDVISPGWQQAKAWLDRHHGSLGAEFLNETSRQQEPLPLPAM